MLGLGLLIMLVSRVLLVHRLLGIVPLLVHIPVGIGRIRFPLCILGILGVDLIP